MCSYICLLVQWLLFTFLVMVSGSFDDWSVCPSFCRCKWTSSKKTAECSKGNLTAVPNLLHRDIQSLDLSFNNIPVLPAYAFKQVGWEKLLKISLQECQIKELDKKAFDGMSLLIELDLSMNNIDTIHADTFISTHSLHILYLNGNPIKVLGNGIFGNSYFLEKVDLSNCSISRIEPKTFDNVRNLQVLDLQGNQLTNIQLFLVESLTELKTLGLEDNPWRCDCQLREFRKWTISRGLYTGPTACAEPSDFRDKYWDSINLENLACEPEIPQPPPETNNKTRDENKNAFYKLVSKIFSG